MTAQQLMNAHPVLLRDTDTIGTAAEKTMSHRLRSLRASEDLASCARSVVDQTGTHGRVRKASRHKCVPASTKP